MLRLMDRWMPHARWLAEETLGLLALGCFLATVAAWAAIFIWGM